MLKPPFRLMVVARSQTGKTTLLIKLIHYYWLKSFDYIHIFCPTYGEDTKWSSLDKHVRKKKIFVYPKVSENLISNIWNKCKVWRQEGKNVQSLILFDDCAGQEGFKTNQETGIINQLVCRSNHANVSTIWSVQKFTQCSTIMRSQAEGLITFSCQQENELKTLYQEFGTGEYGSFKSMTRASTCEPYHYMYLNRQGPGVPDYYHNFKFIPLTIN